MSRVVSNSWCWATLKTALQKGGLKMKEHRCESCGKWITGYSRTCKECKKAKVKEVEMKVDQKLHEEGY